MNNDGNGETKAFRLPSLCSPRTRKLTFVIAQRFEVAGALSTSEPGHVEWKLSKEIWDTFAHYPQGSSIHSPRFAFGASEKMRLDLYPQGQGSSNPRRHTKENLKLEATVDTLTQEKSTAQIGSGTCKAQLGFAEKKAAVQHR